MNSNTGNDLTDKYLVDKVLSGDTHAFGIVVRCTERLVAQIIFKMIADPEDRKDLAQDVYLKTYKKLPGFKFESKLSTWIARICYNTCLDHLRKKKLIIDEPLHMELGDRNEPAGHSAGASGAGADTLLHRKDISAIVKTETGRLPPVYRMLISLFHTEELSYEEIRQITGLPEGTIKSYLFRARKTLKDNISEKYKKEELW